MSCSSDDQPRRPSTHRSPSPPDHTDTAVLPEVRRSSKYDIYGTATKPFGEGYRKSLLVKQDQESGNEKKREDSPLDADSVEEIMGCSVSRTEVALNEESVKGNFLNTNINPPDTPLISEYKINQDRHYPNEVDTKNKNNKNGYSDDMEPKKLSDFEIVYGVSQKVNNNNINGYSTTDLYSEINKPDKSENQKIKGNNQTQREKLMQQIRDRSEDTKENAYSTIAEVKKANEESQRKDKIDKEEENITVRGRDHDDKKVKTIDSSAPVSFVEEEYSYEPDKKEASSKTVVRSRSLVNLEQNQFNYNSTMSCTLKRPNTLKLTTKPDGTIRYGLRQGSSEPTLLDDDSESLPIQDSEIKNNYVSTMKNAFDAVIESQNQTKKGKAEAFDGLRQYFHDNKHGLQELLVNNNVVIIEPFRHDPPLSPSENSDSGSRRTCRITGATIKSPVGEPNKTLAHSNTLPRRNVKSRKNERQGFYHPIKTNKELIDAELPDPDKVKSARELFEQIFQSKPTPEKQVKKQPINSFFNTITSKMRITPVVKVLQGNKQTNDDKKRQGRFLIEQVMKDESKRYPLHKRWTDSGSLSSGVSSDFSCDQDCEFLHYIDGSFSGSNQDILEEYSTDEEDAEYIYPYDDNNERHPVSPEVLQKIRACGTTVTYYGGKVISRSHGQYRSPMTMSIMDEIRQSGGASEGRKKFEQDSDDNYLGVKFRLVKSNSCSSRLEIAGTEDDGSTKLINPKYEGFHGKSIAEEVSEVKDQLEKEIEEENQLTSLEAEEDKAEADQYVSNVGVHSLKSPQVMTWAELKLKEARKQWHCTPEAVRLPAQDMEFETFEVMDDSNTHKAEKKETGRG